MFSRWAVLPDRIGLMSGSPFRTVESMYFNAFDTATGIGAWMRLGNRPNQGHAEMTCCVYLPDGRVGFMFRRPEIADNSAMNAGGMKFEVIEPFKRLRVTYQGEHHGKYHRISLRGAHGPRHDRVL
jgi:hypothetical protein